MIPFEARALIDFCTIIAPPAQACLDADYAGLLDVLITTEDTTTHIVEFAGELDKLLLLGAPPKSLRNPPRRTCVEVRARDLAGRRSEPSVHCFDAADLPRVKELDGGVDERCDAPQLRALPLVGDGEDTTSRETESEPSPEHYEGCTLTLVPPSAAWRGALGLGGFFAIGLWTARRRDGRG